MTVPSRIAGDASVPSLEELRALTRKTFGKTPCNFQLEFAQALLEGKKHVLLQAGCGMGKTLGFWIPLLANPSGLLVVVSPLTLLGDQHAKDLCEVGINAINVDADTIAEKPRIFEVNIFITTMHPSSSKDLQDIEHGVYRVIISSPEQLMKEKGGFEKLFRKQHFTSNLIAVIIDEAHCVKLWGSFRKQFQELGRLRHLLPDRARFAIVSATLPATVLPDVMSRLGVSRKDLHTIQLSNDRPNIALVVRKMKYAANTYMDLDFLVRDTNSDSPADTDSLDGSPPPWHREKFVIFFDDKNEAIAAGDYLRSRLPIDQRQRIIWFMSDMSREFKDDGVEALATGEIWGICSTDSFGMVGGNTI